MIFYEAPHKLVRTLEDLQKTFGADRKISLCRELTKLNEEVRRTTIGEALAFYSDNPPRGEFVLVVDGAKAQDPGEAEFALTVKEQVDAYIEGGMDRMDAIKKVAKERGLAKNDVYKEVATKGSRGK
jgi:16S rRNA (cytidine1402-2'-O)-methyltransferase